MDNMANSNEFLEVDLDSVDSVADLSESITGQLLIGNPVVIAFGEVYALICDTYNEEAVNKVRGIKNRETQKTFSLLVDIPDFLNYAQIINGQRIPLIDFNSMHESSRDFISNPEDVAMVFGNTAFFRIPINPKLSSLIPDWAQNHLFQVQCFSFAGDKAAYEVEKTVRSKLQSSYPDKPASILITSFNISHSTSITDREAAIDLAKASSPYGLTLQVDRMNNKEKKGSYPIFVFTSEGVVLERNEVDDPRVIKVTTELKNYKVNFKESLI